MPTTPPADCRDAIHWFVNNVGVYSASARGIFASEFSDDKEPVLESAVANLASRGINVHVLDGVTIYQQADALWQQALHTTRFGRPVLANAELEMSGAEVLVLHGLQAPEMPHHLWYLYHHVLYPRALSGKPVLITTPLGRDEFVLYGAGCEDIEYAGRKITWEKVIWLIDALTIDLHQFQLTRDEGVAPMLKAEYALYHGLKERGLQVHPQHVVGEYMLDMGVFELQQRKRRDDNGPKIDIECDILSTLDGPGSGQAKRNLLLLNDGWSILRFSIAEIDGDLNGCVDSAMEVWQQGRKKSVPGRLLTGQSVGSVPELPVDDEVQRLAITHGGGPAAVDGGAGTGKSVCITNRVAYLLAQGISPEKILVVSHSNETLRSLKQRIETLGDKLAAQRVNYYSWHDLGNKILKENLSAIKRKPPLKVENNPQKVIQRLLVKYKKELDPTMLELSEELDEFTIASLISLYKYNLITPAHLKERCKSEVDELVAKVAQGYDDQLQKSNKIDRDDMISLAAQILADVPEVRQKYQSQYECILVDEYQEATAAGDLMIRLLAFPQDNLYIVGNEDEALYESKGGLPRLMAEVSIKLPNARCYILEKNWRSHPVIVQHANQLVTGLTRRRVQKHMVPGWGMPPAEAVVGPQMLNTESAEAEWVADEALQLINSGRSPQDIAVLYRYHRYGLIIEESMSRRGIKCVTTHPEAGLIPDEVGDVIAFLRLVMDPDGPKARESFERICQLRVKEVDPKLSATIASFAEANNLSYLKAVEIYSEAVAEPACKDLEQLVRIIRTMHMENVPPGSAISLWKRTQRLNEYYRSIKVPPGVNYEPLRKLSFLEEEALKFKTVSDFVKAHGAPAKGSGDEVEQVVHILTLHEAKGKEFPVVFLVGLAEGLFPAESASDREEERRLCYVGMTRAREMLYVSYPAIFNDVALLPSSFLYDSKLLVDVSAPTVTAPNTVPQAAQSSAQQNQFDSRPAAPAMKPALPATPDARPPATAMKPALPATPDARPPAPAMKPALPATPDARPPAPAMKPALPATPDARPPAPATQPVLPASPDARPPAPVIQPPLPATPDARPPAPVMKPALPATPDARPPVMPVQPLAPAAQMPQDRMAGEQRSMPAQIAASSSAVAPTAQHSAPTNLPTNSPTNVPAGLPTNGAPYASPNVPTNPSTNAQPPGIATQTNTPQIQPAAPARSLYVPARPGAPPQQVEPTPETVNQQPALPPLANPQSTMPAQSQPQMPGHLSAPATQTPVLRQPNYVESPRTVGRSDTSGTTNGAPPQQEEEFVWELKPDSPSQVPQGQGIPNQSNFAVAAETSTNNVQPQPSQPPFKAQAADVQSAGADYAAPQTSSAQISRVHAANPQNSQIPPNQKQAFGSISGGEPLVAPPPVTGGPGTNSFAGSTSIPEHADDYSSSANTAASNRSAGAGRSRGVAPDTVPGEVGYSYPSGKPMQANIPQSASSDDLVEELPEDWFEPAAKGPAKTPPGNNVGQPPIGRPVRPAQTPQSAEPASKAASGPPPLEGSPAEPTERPGAQRRADSGQAKKARQSDEDLIAELLGETADAPDDSSTSSGSKRGLPADKYWDKKRKSTQPVSSEDSAAPGMPAAEESAPSLDLSQAPPVSISPPAGRMPRQRKHASQPPAVAADFTEPPVEKTVPSTQQAPEHYPEPKVFEGYPPVAHAQPNTGQPQVAAQSAHPYSAPQPPAGAVPYQTPPESLYQQQNDAPPMPRTHTPQPQPTHVPSSVPAPAGMPLCPGCALPLEAGSRFCGECGYQLQVRIPACHLCGAPLEPSAKFCGECGSKRGDAPNASGHESDKPTQRTWVNKLSKFMDE